MISSSRIIIKNNPDHLAQEAADIFAMTAKDCVSRNGHFALALSGGSTPRRLYSLLAEEPYRSEVPWDKTSIFWVDERCVPADDPSSNYGTARKDLLDRIPMGKAQLHPMQGELEPESGAIRYQEELIEFFQLEHGVFPIFDLICLGIGKDGHTGSLFPGRKVLNEGEKLTVAVRGGEPDVSRLTMTFPVLNMARQIVFLVSGKEKAAILKTVFESSQNPLPAQRIRPVNGMLTWLMDREAASLISGERA